MTSITLTIRMLIIQSFPLQFFSLYFNSNYCHCLHIQIRHSFTYKSFSFALLTYSRTLGSERKNSCFKAEVHQWQAKISNPFSWASLITLLMQSEKNYCTGKSLTIFPILSLSIRKHFFATPEKWPTMYLYKVDLFLPWQFLYILCRFVTTT